MPDEPTRADILEAFKAHAEEDHRVSAAQAEVNIEFLTFKAETEGTLATLATKEDIKEVIAFMKEIKVGFGIFRFSFDNAAKIGSFILLIGGIFVLFKVGFVAALAFLFGNNKP